MRFLKPTLGFLLPLVAILVIVRFSSVSSPEPPSENGKDWIAEVYDPFDTLRTDPEAYRWPTDASTIINSAFAEFRRTHFHAGIDISTRGQQGYRVFASRAGYVSRLSVSATGYGIFIDIRHRDGFTTRYAHLQRFNDTLQSFIRMKQLETVRYQVEVTFDSAAFPVRAGELIAYSGETGIGAPHLHFELRDPAMNPINPLRLPAFRRSVEDDRAPVFRSVAVEPLDYRSRVNGSHRPVLVGAVHVKDSLYRLSSRLKVSGSAGLSVRISDPFNGTWYKSGPYEVTMMVDDSLIFTTTLDQIDASQSEQVALHYNWPILSRGRYQNLYVKTGNRMPLYDRLPEGAGTLSYEHLQSGRHSLDIIARDFHGNTAWLQAELEVESPNGARAELAQGGLVKPLPEGFSPSPPQLAHGTSAFSGDEAADEKTRPLVRTVTWHPEKREGSPILTIEKEFSPTYAVVTLRTHGSYTLRPSVWVTAGDERRLIDIDAADARTYAGTFPLEMIHSDRVTVEAYAEVDGAPVKASDEFTVAVVRPGETTVVHSPDGRFMATFGEDAVYEPLYVRLEQLDAGFSLEPRTVLMKEGAEIVMTSAEPDSSGTLGLYVGEEWNMDYAGRRIELAPARFRVRLGRMLSPVSIHRDTSPPVISSLRVRPSRKAVRVDFRVWDDLSGIRSDDIAVWIDGEPLIPVYDPYSRSVSAEGPITSTTTPHEVRVHVQDRSANASERQQKFTTRSR